MRNVREYSGVGGESGDGDANVIIDSDQLLLVRSEFARRSLVHEPDQLRTPA